MEIKLYYVEGISKEDTPFFSSASEQTRYFESHKELTIETTWYPPYYNNVINTDQLTINNKVNYLSFKYQGHTFYYFINSTNYIADGLIDLNIELDYIQTYMFNMSFTSTIIDREHINRWKRGALSTMVFNRDYLRDNNSRGNFILTNKKIYDTDDIPSTNSFKPQGWLVINYSSAFSELGTIRRTRWKNTNLKNNLVTPYYQVLYPIGEDFTEVAMYSQGSSPQLGVTYLSLIHI